MVIDGATLHDLDVLSTSTPRGPTVCGLVDRTKTRAGRECLGQFLATPGRTAEDILALQHAHRIIAAEVRRIRSLAMALHEHESICAVLDEPFRGTNVHDASEATLAIISRLLERPGALVFVASHLAEVTPALDNPHARLLHFSAEVVNERPEFDYHLRDGTSTQRLGVILLKQEKVLELLDSVKSKTHPIEERPIADR